MSDYPLYLQLRWFLPSNASALRGHIRAICLSNFIEQVTPRPATQRWA